MSAAFYKSSDPAVLAALSAFDLEATRIASVGKAFAAHYGGEMLARRDVYGYSIAGLHFQPAKDDPLWTKPDAKQANMQRPRNSLRKAAKDQRAALAALLADWAERLPSEKAEFAPVLEAMGTDWGNLFFCGFVMFQHDGHVYVSTNAPLAPCMVEILSSEYRAANVAYDKAKEAA